ncbi:metal-dependent transcriptional regulator [Opitutus sp. GAS368]|jgi:DtxR family Mn-dependent transcriptional regulator|uniref:metal-dependent transcriptional regulator n=1 Tax=Opitutus sp. GAS368 TaxID=1882749 RepID=UPI00087BC1D3|nr:metal-dependent transcriptional regulator [Opitutus sp. GAS368]SDS53799.1 iron (metal) dependent repressor, DtxR family [Opitutus sp. GAS368]
MPTSTVEDYLKQILLLAKDGDELVPMGGIAEGLHVVPGTVTTMVKSLAGQELVEHHPHQGVRLTSKGRKLALNVLRKHRLVETFLVTTLKMDWTEVHVEAERLEHALSERVLERIDALLGHPKVDPHGDPIPSAQGKLDTRAYGTLATCAVQAPLRLVRITDQSAEFLQFADRQRLVPDALLTVTARTEAAGIVTVRLKSGKSMTLGFEQAGKILIERI